MNDLIDTVIDYFKQSREVLFITGAGISADSGVPTYRGIGGLYGDDLTEDGIRIEQALSGAMLETRPDVCWKYIAQIEAACRGAKPNRAHEFIAELERGRPRVWVLTQNVDGLHRAAGSENVITIHGNVHDLHCVRCDYQTRVDDYAALEIPPSCPKCSALVRPDVVLFGEMLPNDALSALSRELGRGFDLVVSVGTSNLFPYISQPVLAAKDAGITTIEINPEETVVSGLVDAHLAMGAKDALGAVGDALSS